MLPTTNKKTVGKKTVGKKTASKKAPGKPLSHNGNGLAARKGLLARRQWENRFIGATKEETDQRVEEYDRFLAALSDEEIDRELAKLSSEELHALAWISTYNQHNKRRKGRKK